MSVDDSLLYVGTALVSILTLVLIIRKLYWSNSQRKKPLEKSDIIEARRRHFEEKLEAQETDTTGNREETEVAHSLPLSSPKNSLQKNTVVSYSLKNEDELFSAVIKIPLIPKVIQKGTADEATSVPTTRPISALKDLLSWIPGYDEFSVARIPLQQVYSENPAKPKTLICHDMQGGYIDDRFPQGINSNECYTFEHWNFIDTFVYFSHHLVTVPPPCWVNAGHCHGVKVLGTFITEWKDGAEMCASFLQDQRSCKTVAMRLTEIACYYGFDGWLINIENEIKDKAQDSLRLATDPFASQAVHIATTVKPVTVHVKYSETCLQRSPLGCEKNDLYGQPSQVDNLCYFVKMVTMLMHKRKPWSEVIWYDSVTYKGDLKWQNELNRDNRMFFDVCDGIFLNYNWSVHHLARSTIVSGPLRKHNVYVGIDVFGRGTFGGGGFNSFKAMQVIRDQGLSAAIFAPGWVMEVHGKENFIENQQKFWSLLMSYLYPHCPASLPLVTSFCRGFGHQIKSNGEVFSNEPWTNLSSQQLQSNFVGSFYLLGTRSQVHIETVGPTTTDAFLGGGCFSVSGNLTPSSKDETVAVVRLFRTQLEPKKKPLFISYTFTSTLPSSYLEPYVILVLDQEPNYVVLQHKSETTNEEYDSQDIEWSTVSLSCKTKCSYPIPDGQKDNYVAFEPIGYRHHDWVSKHVHGKKIDQSGKWSCRHYLMPNDILNSNAVIKEIRLALVFRKCTEIDTSHFEFKLGDFKMIERDSLHDDLPSAVNFRCRDTSWRHHDDRKVQLTTTLSWDHDPSGCVPLCHDIFVNYISMDKSDDIQDNSDHTQSKLGDTQDNLTYLGRSYVDSFCVTNLPVGKQICSGIHLTIHPVSIENIRYGGHTHCVKLMW